MLNAASQRALPHPTPIPRASDQSVQGWAQGSASWTEVTLIPKGLVILWTKLVQPVYKNQIILNIFGQFYLVPPLEFSEKAEPPFPICLQQQLQPWLMYQNPLPPARPPYTYSTTSNNSFVANLHYTVAGETSAHLPLPKLGEVGLPFHVKELDPLVKWPSQGYASPEFNAISLWLE